MNTLSRFDTVLSALVFPRTSSGNKATETTLAQPVAEARPLFRDRPKLSNLPPTPRPRSQIRPRRRARTTTSSIKLPPPSTPIILRIALALWSILLSFWTSLVGETRATRVTRKRQSKGHQPTSLMQTLQDAGRSRNGGSSDEGDDASGSDGDVGSDDEALDTSPVTQNIDTTPVDQPDDSEFVLPNAKPHRESFSFRLRSADKQQPGTNLRDTAAPPTIHPYQKSQQPTSILSNPIKKANRLLPNPMSTSLLDPSVPLSQTTTIPGPPPPAPRIHQTPFHHQKTLILDLDETLIHSTSRPMSSAASAGGGLLGLSFGGLLGGGRRSRREGHTVEVVLNGRSTTYYVYKRPYVDHFLKKVSRDSLRGFADPDRSHRGTLS